MTSHVSDADRNRRARPEPAPYWYLPVPPLTTMAEEGRRTELAAFLRSRRASLSPQTVGLPFTGRRRTPGLRREEVAVLADVSVTWYTFLEQGRPIRISPEALLRVASALRLADLEVRHLFLLAERTPPRTPAVDDVPERLLDVMASLTDSPAWLVNPTYDALSWNRASAAVWLDLDAVCAEERNLVWLMLTRPEPPALHVDWASDARRTMAALRARHAERGNDPRFEELVDRLTKASPFFREWWPRHEIHTPAPCIAIRHPRAGLLRFSATTFRPDPGPGLRLLVWTPDMASRARLRQFLAEAPASGPRG